MKPDQISQIVNRFVKTTIDNAEDAQDVEGLKIALLRGDDHWDLVAASEKPDGALLWVDFPKWEDDKMAFALDTAAMLSQRLNRYFAGVKGNAARSEAAKKASAKKAIEARWAKSRKKD